jgi:hypothetical protein
MQTAVKPTSSIYHYMTDGKLVTEMFRVSGLHLTMLIGAMAVRDVRSYLNGIYLDLEGDEPCLVATNGHIMATCPVFLDREIHMPEILQFIAERRAEKSATGHPRYRTPGSLIFRPQKAPHGKSAEVSVDLRAMRMWDASQTDARYERYIEALEDGVFPAWRKVHLGLDGDPGREKDGKNSLTTIGIDLSILTKVWGGPVRIDILGDKCGYLVTPVPPQASGVSMTVMPCRY